MSNLKIDSTTGAVALEGGNFVWLDDDDTNLAAQNIEQRLNSVRGDWYLDLRSGLPYFHGILGEKNGDILARTSYRKAILSCPYVKSIITFKMVFDASARLFTVYFDVLLHSNRRLKSTDFKPIIIRVR